jgi:N-acetylmuramoyl-L-alanine amidase
MKVVISSGHSKYVRGAKGVLDEVDEARRVVEEVATIMKSMDAGVQTFNDDVSRTQSENLKRIVDYHNAQTRDYDVSVHFNAYQTTSKPMGTECLYVTQSSMASAVAKKIHEATKLPNRGAKKRTDLYFLNNTKKPAILIEVCFVDSSADAAAYKEHFRKVCTGIAEAITGKIGTNTEETQSEPDPWE